MFLKNNLKQKNSLSRQPKLAETELELKYARYDNESQKQRLQRRQLVIQFSTLGFKDSRQRIKTDER